MGQKLQYTIKFGHTHNGKYLDDVFDGEKVQKLRDRGWFTLGANDFDFVLSTDGGLDWQLFPRLAKHLHLFV